MGKRKISFEHSNNLKLSLRNSGNMTIKNFYEIHKKFMENKSLQGLATRTIEEHLINMEYFKRYIGEETQFDITDVQIGVDIFKSYLYWMIYDKNYSPFTVNIRLRTIKNYLNWLYEEKYLNTNISIKLKLVKVPQDMIKPLSDLEVKNILKACDLTTYAGFRDFALMLTMLDTGIRVGESSELKIRDVDLKQRLINVRAEVAKTRVFRQLPISVKTAKILKELIDVSVGNNCEYLFQSTYGGKIKKQNLILSFRRLGKKAGLEKRCTPHVFRHTFATNAVKAGMDLFTLQRIMGHSTLVTTRKYIQLDTDDLKVKHDKVNTVDRYFK